MQTQLQIAELDIDVVYKGVKNVHLSVYPPSGKVRITVPQRTNIETVRAYAISKLDWIRKRRTEMQKQERETARDFRDRESHYLWGQRRLLRVIERPGAPEVLVTPKRLTLAVHPGTGEERRGEILAKYYRDQVRERALPLIETWEPKLGVRHSRLFVQRMKTRWGSCTPSSGSIRLNTELAKKPVSCLEYIIVHELIHLLEPTHNDRFRRLMSEHLPDWPERRRELNRLPVRHEEWLY